MTTVFLTRNQTLTAAGVTTWNMPIPKGEWMLEYVQITQEFATGQPRDGYASINVNKGGANISISYNEPISPAKPFCHAFPKITVTEGDLVIATVTYPTYANNAILRAFLKKVAE